MGRLQIDILGTSFNIQSDESDVYLNKLLDYYKDILTQLRKTTSIADSLQLSILAGISICDELYKAKTRNARITKHTHNTMPDHAEMERITLKLIEDLDSALRND